MTARNSGTEPPEIQPADPAARRRVILLLIAGAVIGACALWSVQRYLPGELAATDPELYRERLYRAVYALAMLSFAGLLAAGGGLVLLGRRILDADRFPPPGSPLVRPTRVHHGVRARLIGRCVILGGSLLLLGALLAPMLLLELGGALLATAGARG